MKQTAFSTLMPMALLIISLTTLSSCKKDKDETPAVTIQNLAGSYKLGAMTYKDGNQPEVDLMVLMDACEKDNIMTLKTDKTYNNVDAGVQCVPPDNYSGDWDLPSSTTITIDGDNLTVDSYDGKVLKLSDTYTSGGVTEVTKITLNKQ